MTGALEEALSRLGLPHRDLDIPDAEGRFPDGSRFHVEIPSVEGPEAFQTVLDTADHYGVRVHRISQGSGIMLQTDDEIRCMVALGKQRDVEVCLFVGPRAGWDIGAQAVAQSGSAVAGSLRGASQLAYGVDDVLRGCELGLRSVLVADVGQLWVLAQMKRTGDLPEDLVLKTSVAIPAGNPATARVLEDLGASTINIPVDLTLQQVASIRRAVSVPLDLYVESPDDLGGLVRHHETSEIVRIAAPVHLKFSVRNAPNLYPSGTHLRPMVIATAEERVRRAAIALSLMNRAAPNLK